MSDNPSTMKKDPAAPHHPHHPRAVVAEARRGLTEIMLSKFSSTPLQEVEYTLYDEMELRKQLAEDREDAALTMSEREYLSALLRSGDVPSMEKASAVLRDDRLFPKNPACLEADSSPGASAAGSEDDGDGEMSLLAKEDDDVSTRSSSNAEMERRRRLEQEKSYLIDATPPPQGGSRVHVQRELFRLHESERHLKPSQLVQRLNFVHKNSILSQESSSYTAAGAGSDHYPLRDSSLLSYTEDVELRQQPSHMDWTEPETPIMSASTDDEQTTVTNFLVNDPTVAAAVAAATTSSPSWNPFEDVSSWLDNSQQGVEVSDDGTPQMPRDDNNDNNVIMSGSSSTAAVAAAGGQSSIPTDDIFRILGTTADDVSCHPHVLSPPLMESLLAFVPEEYQQHEPIAASPHQQPPPRPLNLWLKYSLARDGPTMWAFLRKVRASTVCFLAIETDGGHVFGSFTTQPWRLSQGWYGRGEDTFVWRLRRSRLESAGQSIVDQVNHESEIQVFPYRPSSSSSSGGDTTNAVPAIQYCSKRCLWMGQGEILESSPTTSQQHDIPASEPAPAIAPPPLASKATVGLAGKHYGHALSLDKDLQRGTTSSSETFGNPCLVDPTRRGARFTVANIEVWAVTSHGTVAEAEQTELSNLFLDHDPAADRADQQQPHQQQNQRQGRRRNHFMNMLVGGPT
jgi:TLD